MPKNQFQRPAPVQHTQNVPRHGKPLPPPAKVAAKAPTRAVSAGLPPLSVQLETQDRK